MLFFLVTKLNGQQNFSFEHFSVEDGLPHNVINQIIQDKKGFIWLATNNGLSKYNGYTFQNYKTNPTDDVHLKNDRIDKIHEDSYGRIWIKSNGLKANSYCFDPKMERFWSSELIPFFSNEGFNSTQIKVNKSGFVWLLSEADGCVLISDSLFSSKVYNKKLNTLKAQTVYSVFEDIGKNSWLLTNNGLAFVKHNNLENPTFYFSKDLGNKTSFFSAVELDDEIWFGGSKGEIVRYSKSGRSFRKKKLELDADITWLAKLNEQTIIAVTDKKGFFTINRYNGNIQLYNSAVLNNISTNNLVPIAITQNSQFWFVNNSEKGINLYDFSTQKLYGFPPDYQGLIRSNIPVSAFVVNDYKGDIWVQPYGGGFSKFDVEKHKLIPFKYTGYFPHGNFTNSFHTVFLDKQGNLWYNTHAAGLVKVVFSDNNFKKSNVSKKSNLASTQEVRSMLQDDKGNIWVGNKQNQVVILDKYLNEIGSLSPDGKLEQNSRWDKAVYKIMQDSQLNIWIGTRGDGLYKLIPLKKNHSYKVVHFLMDETNPYSLTSNDIYDVFEDKNKQIWVGTFDGVNLLSSNKKDVPIFISHKNRWKSYPKENFKKVRCIKQTSEGLIYVGATNGLLVFNPNKLYNEDSGLKSYEVRLDQNQRQLSSNDIIDICITKNKEIFIATVSGGINKVVKKDHLGFPIAFKSFTQINGLPSDNINSLLEDVDGKVWIASDYALTRFNPKQEFFETFQEVKSIMSDYNFSEATRLRLDSGELLFGYSEGIIHFYPDQIMTNNYTPYLALSNFQLFDQKVSIEKKSPLNLSIDDSNKLILEHNENFFKFEFAALDYKNSPNIKYAYILEGFDKNWNVVQSNRTANYTNVPKGNYLFKIKSTNSLGVWVQNERVLPITIKPSVWNTNLAYIVYAILAVALFLAVNYTIITIYRLKNDAKLEKEVFLMKQKFFIDVSHELRTPLTLISSPIDYMLNDNRTPEFIKKQLLFIAHSSSRLQRLVNQILDFRKIEDTSLKVSEIKLARFVNDICSDFLELAKEQGINFSFQNDADEATIWVDRNGLEKIVFNLLSNAFKYTPKGKSIVVKITKSEKLIAIHVIDEGFGISKQNQGKLFNRFVSFNNERDNPSTGIGLSLVKEIAEKHNAKLQFDSEEGKGSTFSVYFKVGKEHFSKDVEFIIEEETANEGLELRSKHVPNTNQGRIKILIVEDELELRLFIKSILEETYELIEAENGEVGYELAVNKNPDFIISDIMMPKLNGVELLKKIRNNVETSHIPVILLTAKTNIESKLDGLSYGADDYITKPFSVSYFMARIENLINQRKRLQSIYGVFGNKELNEYEPMPCLITDEDEKIMKKVMLIIEDNMDNKNFSVEELGLLIGINRTTFGYKIKSLTGFTPVEFIRDIRLKRAAQLIVDTQLLVKEIASLTGFSDMKYFSKSFKKKYGVTPLDYRKQNN